MFQKNIVFLFLMIGLSVSAQQVLRGKVFSAIDHKPLAKASVFINSTSRSTYTNDEGEFAITSFLYPCQLVVSHINYKREVVELLQSSDSIIVELEKSEIRLDTLEVKLNEQNTSLKGSVKKLRNRRNENFNEFVKLFLGSDKWGKAAVIKNDPQLRFWHQIDTVYRSPDKSDTILLSLKKTLGNGYCWSKDSTQIIQYAEYLYANTLSGITMELPLLGYDVTIDLARFRVGELNDISKMDYAYYSCFVPRSDTLTISKKKIDQNRKEVYYNSTQHFFRSLFSHSLYKNGYLLAFDRLGYNWQSPEYRKYCKIDSLITRISDNTYLIKGLKNKRLNITYFCENNNVPLDLTREIRKNGSIHIPLGMYDETDNSYLEFQNDSCLVRADGIALNNDILIGGKMGVKSAGASLPIDYEPGIADEKKKQK
ncbi:MAG: hypothetical protein RIS29_1810 [Bacteroidota bacterium]|jgi:hypothetical protein